MKKIEPHLIMERLSLIALIITGIFFLSTSCYAQTKANETSSWELAKNWEGKVSLNIHPFIMFCAIIS